MSRKRERSATARINQQTRPPDVDCPNFTLIRVYIHTSTCIFTVEPINRPPELRTEIAYLLPQFNAGRQPAHPPLQA